MCSLFVSSLKKLSKKNRKLQKIIANEPDNIASKIFNYYKKIKYIGPDHYHIALSLHNKYCKMSSMRLPSLVIFIRQLQKSPSAGGFTPRLLLSYSKLQLRIFLARTFHIKHLIIISSTKVTKGLSRHFAWTFHFNA